VAWGSVGLSHPRWVDDESPYASSARRLVGDWAKHDAPRGWLWSQALAISLDRWALGSGPGSFGATLLEKTKGKAWRLPESAAPYHPDSDWLALAAECGWVAALALLALLALGAVRAMRSPDPEGEGAGASLVAAIVCAAAGTGMSEPALAVVVGVCLAQPAQAAVRDGPRPRGIARAAAAVAAAGVLVLTGAVHRAESSWAARAGHLAELELAPHLARPDRLMDAWSEAEAAGEHESGRRALAALREHYPALPHLWLALGTRASAAGRLGEAREALERALQLRPGLARAQKELAMVLLRGGDAAGAAALGDVLPDRDRQARGE
jgi:hypothetical protein